MRVKIDNFVDVNEKVQYREFTNNNEKFIHIISKGKEIVVECNYNIFKMRRVK